MSQFVTFLSDYGHGDDFVGVCHGVIARIAPAARIIDITHGVPRHQVRPAAVVLRNTLPYMPSGIHLAVVDPEVGGDRRGVALRLAYDDRILVGPDNGLLQLAVDRFGGVVEAVDIGTSRHRLEPFSLTFHGRDLFAPVAAALAAGEPLAEAGDPIDPSELVGLLLPRPYVQDEQLVVHATYVDRFGNVALDADHRQIVEFGLQVGGRVLVDTPAGRFPATYVSTFADVRPGEVLVYEDAYRTLAVAVNRASAAATLGIGLDAELRLRAA